MRGTGVLLQNAYKRCSNRNVNGAVRCAFIERTVTSRTQRTCGTCARSAVAPAAPARVARGSSVQQREHHLERQNAVRGEFAESIQHRRCRYRTQCVLLNNGAFERTAWYLQVNLVHQAVQAFAGRYLLTNAGALLQKTVVERLLTAKSNGRTFAERRYNGRCSTAAGERERTFVAGLLNPPPQNATVSIPATTCRNSAICNGAARRSRVQVGERHDFLRMHSGAERGLRTGAVTCCTRCHLVRSCSTILVQVVQVQRCMVRCNGATLQEFAHRSAERFALQRWATNNRNRT